MSKHTPLVLIHFILMVPRSYTSSWSFSFVSLTMSLVSYFSRLMTNDRNNMRELYCYRTERYVSFFIARMIIFLCFLSATIATSTSYTPLHFSFLHIPFCYSSKSKKPINELSSVLSTLKWFIEYYWFRTLFLLLQKSYFFPHSIFFFSFFLCGRLQLKSHHFIEAGLTWPLKSCVKSFQVQWQCFSHSHYQKSQPLSCNVENILSPSIVCSHVWIWICAFSYSV